ncbi:hypothetical protein HGM15179_016227 [Zosterops borbonicus]|uniref:Uncharacterized protein n=1 Tax=Zosterops borbonicus TaxID=364589 RepID=A0A8K1LEJ8_9PASS|nr:hypothetical protein HGM15179_016227 [Zosterops borbonicus]
MSSWEGYSLQFSVQLKDFHSPIVQKSDVKKEQLQGIWSSAFPNTSSELAKGLSVGVHLKQVQVMSQQN